MPREHIPAETVTRESALANASRILNNAEMTTDLALMERLEHLADSWIAISMTLSQDR